MSYQTSKEVNTVTRGWGWSSFNRIDELEMNIFIEAVGTSHTIGNVDYKPQKVSTQVAAGINYKFRCKARPTNKTESPKWEAVVEIFQPLDGKAHVIHITT